MGVSMKLDDYLREVDESRPCSSIIDFAKAAKDRDVLVLLLRAAMEMRDSLDIYSEDYINKFDSTVADILEGKDG